MPRRSATSSSTPGSTVLLVDAGARRACVQHLPVEHRFVLGRGSDAELFRGAGAIRGSASPTRTPRCPINYTSGTTARPKGVQLTHRNFWLNAVTFGWHDGVTDRDVYLHTLPTFHCNGWGMPYALTAMGARQVVIRKIDGEEILRRIEAEGVTLLNGAPAVVAAMLDAAAARRERGEPTRPGPRAHRRGRRPAAVEDDRAGADRARLGIHPDLRAHRDVTAPHHQSRRRRVGRASIPRERARRLSRAGVPAVGVRIAVDDRAARSSRAPTTCSTATGSSRRRPTAALVGGWFHTGDGGHLDDGPTSSITDRKKDVIITGGENVSSIEVEDCLYQHPAVAEAAVIGVPDEKWGETVLAFVGLRPGAVSRSARSDRSLPRATRALQVSDVDGAARPSLPRPRPASSRSSAARAVLGGRDRRRQLKAARGVLGGGRPGNELPLVLAAPLGLLAPACANTPGAAAERRANRLPRVPRARRLCSSIAPPVTPEYEASAVRDAGRPGGSRAGRGGRPAGWG